MPGNTQKNEKFVLLKAEYSNRPMYWEGRKADIKWIRERGFEAYASRQEAKRAWLFAMKELEATEEYTDKFIDQIYAPFQRMELTRVGKLSDYGEVRHPGE